MGQFIVGCVCALSNVQGAVIPILQKRQKCMLSFVGDIYCYSNINSHYAIIAYQSMEKRKFQGVTYPIADILLTAENEPLQSNWAVLHYSNQAFNN